MVTRDATAQETRNSRHSLLHRQRQRLDGYIIIPFFFFFYLMHTTSDVLFTVKVLQGTRKESLESSKLSKKKSHRQS